MEDNNNKKQKRSREEEEASTEAAPLESKESTEQEEESEEESIEDYIIFGLIDPEIQNHNAFYVPAKEAFRSLAVHIPLTAWSQPVTTQSRQADLLQWLEELSITPLRSRTTPSPASRIV